MRIYLAARFSRIQEMQAVKADLEKLGHTITSRWVSGGHRLSDAGLSEEAKETERIRFAMEDLYDLCNSEAIICFTEAPRSVPSRGGRHVEFGVAFGRMRLIVVGPRENVFYCLPNVQWYPDYPTFLMAFTLTSR